MHKHFILHLTLIENIGPAVIQKIKERSDVNPSDLYSFSPTDWMHTFGFSQSTSEKLTDGLANTKILETELALIEQNNIQWVTFEEESYPQLLKNIYLPPAVLYIQGSLSCAQTTTTKLLAVVGARKADEYGYRIVNQLVPELVAADYTIVSGGAVGIDAAAHAATIKSGGTTIAVLGSGLLLPYPSSNKKLFESIVAQGGCLMSSFPLMMEALPGHFPARNRIVTGLSHGCLVVQAAQKSGALISAHYALEQGREVFAIPGPIDSELSAGCNTLIQQGAKLVTCTTDILEEFGDLIILPDKKVIQEKAVQMSLESLQRVRPAVSDEALAKSEAVEGYERIKKDKYSNYSSQQKSIITACKKPISFDDIINSTQLSPELLQTELFNLQLDGIISQDFTGMWSVM
jgi:DNA processing protein